MHFDLAVLSCPTNMPHSIEQPRPAKGKDLEVALVKVLQDTAEDILGLPTSSIQLVAVLVTMQDGLPLAVKHYLLEKLAMRCGIEELSEAAIALIKLYVYSEYTGCDQIDAQRNANIALLNALRLTDKVTIAAAFMCRLEARIEKACRHTLPSSNDNNTVSISDVPFKV